MVIYLITFRKATDRQLLCRRSSEGHELPHTALGPKSESLIKIALVAQVTSEASGLMSVLIKLI